MSSRTSKMAERLKGHKKGIDADESRQRREEVTTELRKNKREDMMQKRRMMRADGTATDASAPSVSAAPTENVNAANGHELSNEDMIRQIPALMAQMQRPTADEQLEAVAGFRKILSIGTHSPPHSVFFLQLFCFMSFSLPRFRS